MNIIKFQTSVFVQNFPLGINNTGCLQ